MKIAGLDLSTSVCGYCVFDDGELVKYDYHKFKKKKDWEHIDLVEQFKKHVYPEIKDVDKIIVEDSLKKYAGGFSSNKSITVLLQFNAIITYILKKELGRDIIKHLHPSTARKLALGSGRSPKGVDAKEWVLTEVSKLYGITWPRTRYDNIRSQCEDVADAIILARAELEELNS